MKILDQVVATNMMAIELLARMEDLEVQFREGHVALNYQEVCEARATMIEEVLARFGFTRTTIALHTNN